jgi:hypothetical protein
LASGRTPDPDEPALARESANTVSARERTAGSLQVRASGWPAERAKHSRGAAATVRAGGGARPLSSPVIARARPGLLS